MNIENMLPKLIRAGFENDMKSFEVIAITIASKLKKTNALISDEINEVIFNKNVGNNSYRSVGLDNLPTGKKNNLNLINVKEIDNIEEPILPENIKILFQKFINEQSKAQDLMSFGVKPSNSILLYGEPGVGKTYSAQWLSMKLGKPLIVLDLSSVISSYLGETGANLRSVLDYAKSNNAILFLDEFDAIAKKRDDVRDVGELKRIVNVLLKELEEWPIGSMVIAATNHPELLDKAIWRRFDLKIEIEMPNKAMRKEIVSRELSNFKDVNNKFVDLLADATTNESAAEIVRICDDLKREYVLSNKDINSLIISRMRDYIDGMDVKQKKQLVTDLHELNTMSVNEICEITSIPKSTIYRYIKID